MLIPNSVYTVDNQYGYRLNINHPLIRKFYYRYKRWKNIPVNMPLSDKERFDFEEYILAKLENDQKEVITDTH